MEAGEVLCLKRVKRIGGSHEESAGIHGGGAINKLSDLASELMETIPSVRDTSCGNVYG